MQIIHKISVQIDTRNTIRVWNSTWEIVLEVSAGALARLVSYRHSIDNDLCTIF